MIIPCQRDAFNLPRDICYLNAAYMTPLTRKQQLVGELSVCQSSMPWEVTSADFFPVPEEIRRLSARLINASADDMAIVPAVSYGIATAAKNLSLSKGAKILVLDKQFPANVYEWRLMADKAGASVETIATPKDDDWTSAILATLETDASFEIVALPQVHWASGAAIDLVAVSVACKKIGASLVLDLTQSVGAMPIDIAAVDPDFAVMGSYKWMMGPYGLGAMYVAPRWQNGQPLEQGWIVRAESENFAGLVDYKDTYAAGARRFDVGERSNFILCPIMAEGLRQLLEWGVENIAETLLALNTRLASAAEEQGFRPIDNAYRSPHMLGVHVGDKGPDLLEQLNVNKVHASLRGDMLRIAPHLWIDDEDEQTFIQALGSH